MSTLLSDVLDIPLAAGDEDYVLRLTDGIDKTRIAVTIDEYVVTPALVQAFEQALGLVSEAMTTGVSRGAFLSGSFGSGKSHFMAVLYALLRHDSTARDKEELQSVIGKHDAVLLHKDVLPLAFHLLAAKSMEEALFGGYVRQVRALHPGAPLPALYNADKLFADADQMRVTAGDERFFSGLNGDSGGGPKQADPWTKLLGDDVTWTAQSYADAKAAAPGAELRQRLVTALTRTYFRSYTNQAEFVDIDTGLAVIAEHAKSLGHDAVVLFLDELVLWLAFGVQDREFFRVESQKLTKLVESGTGPRAIPLIAFVARQMDLRRWFADSGANGAEQEALDRAFRHQEGRFGTITLGDDNLPHVARRRLLRRRSDNPAAEVTLQDAFKRISRTPAIWDVLLDGVNTDDRHRGADEKAFELTYPFSPALVSTLRDLASVMQRERTALKVMQQMLVDRRDTLTVNDVIPVGDSFDYIVSGSQPLDAQAAALFKSANVLYRDKLRPLILADNGLTEADAAEPAKLTPAFRAHDRLAKTLLLSAVAPRVPALKELTAARLASLNHGSITSPLPGSEAAIVLTKVKQWSQRVPEIHVGADPKNPVIRVQLSDVDYESVVDNAKGEDNDGRRRELIRDLVRDALGVAELNPDAFGAYYHPVVWRGSKRTVDLVFGNVRDVGWLTDDHFRARAGTWRFVIDFPFDDPGFSSAQDLERIERILERGPRERVIAWLPRFLSPERMADVSRLVILDWLLTGTGERWRTNADHLSEVDRAQARAILESQRTALREGLRRAIQEAYGAARETPGTLAEDTAQDKILHSFDLGFTPASPVGADLGAAFRNLVDQAFSSTYPAHPRFEPADTEITVRDLQAVYGHVERAVADPDGRVRLEGDVASVRRVANVLGVGNAAETHFLFGDDQFTPWAAEFERAAARDGIGPGEPVTVGQARKWIEELRPAYGLRDEVMDLIVLAWAALRTRSWYERGGPVPTPRPGSTRSDMELRPEPMPKRAEWQKAASRAEALFGLRVNPYLTASSVAELAADIQQRTSAFADDASALVSQVEYAYQRLGIGDGARLVTAKAGRDLLDALRKAGGDRVRLIKALAEADLPGTETALANSLTQARDVASALKAFRWDRLAPLHDAEKNTDDRGRSAASALNALRTAIRKDEFAERITPTLAAADEALFEWLASGRKPDPDPGLVPPPGPGPDKPVPPGTPAGSATRAPGTGDSAVLAELTSFLRAHPSQVVHVEWRVTE